ncbi:hypothetical protein ACO0QE_002078 [Hanseniaspora vineae]
MGLFTPSRQRSGANPPYDITQSRNGKGAANASAMAAASTIGRRYSLTVDPTVGNKPSTGRSRVSRNNSLLNSARASSLNSSGTGLQKKTITKTTTQGGTKSSTGKANGSKKTYSLQKNPSNLGKMYSSGDQNNKSVYYDAQEAFDEFGGPQAKGNLIKKSKSIKKSSSESQSGTFKSKPDEATDKKFYKYVPTATGLVMVELSASEESKRLRRSSSIATSMRRTSSNISQNSVPRSSSLTQRASSTSRSNSATSNSALGSKFQPGQPPLKGSAGSGLKRSASMNAMKEKKNKNVDSDLRAPPSRRSIKESNSSRNSMYSPMKKKLGTPDYIPEETVTELEEAAIEEGKHYKPVSKTSELSSTGRKTSNNLKVNPLTVKPAPVATKRTENTSATVVTKNLKRPKQTIVEKNSKPASSMNAKKDVKVSKTPATAPSVQEPASDHHLKETQVTKEYSEFQQNAMKKEEPAAITTETDFLSQPPVINIEEEDIAGNRDQLLGTPTKPQPNRHSEESLETSNPTDDKITTATEDHNSMASLLRSNNSYLNKNGNNNNNNNNGIYESKFQPITSTVVTTPQKHVPGSETLSDKRTPSTQRTPIKSAMKKPDSSETLNAPQQNGVQTRRLSQKASSTSLKKNKTPMKSALKKSTAGASQNNPSAAEQAYLKLTTAENTRLNAQLMDENQPKSKIIRSPSKRLSTLRMKPIVPPAAKASANNNSNGHTKLKNSGKRNSTLKPAGNPKSSERSSALEQAIKTASKQAAFPPTAADSEKKSSFERERPSNSNMGFKLMSLRGQEDSESGDFTEGALNGASGFGGRAPKLARSYSGDADDDDFNKFRKSFKSKFQDSDSDSEILVPPPRNKNRRTSIISLHKHSTNTSASSGGKGAPVSTSSAKKPAKRSNMLSSFHETTTPTPTLRAPAKTKSSREGESSAEKKKSNFGGKLKKLFGRSKK